MYVTIGDLDGDFIRIGLHPGEHLVEHDADRVEVGADIRASPRDELRRHISDSADQGLGRRRGSDGARQTEVRELDLTIGAEEDIVGFEIAMDDSRGMDCFECCEDRIEDDDRLTRSEGAPVLELAAQSHRRQVLHHKIDRVAVAGLVMDGHEIRVGQPSGVDGLASEPFDEGVVADEVVMHDLDRDLTVKAQIRAAVDHRHSTARDLRVDAVPVIENGADERIRTGTHSASCIRCRCI